MNIKDDIIQRIRKAEHYISIARSEEQRMYWTGQKDVLESMLTESL